MQATHSGFEEAILVADDSVTIVAMVSARLARGAAALALVRERRPRLVVLDVEMPGLDGIAVTEQIRADPELVGTLVILLTGNAHPEHVDAGIAAGADAYVTKPFSP